MRRRETWPRSEAGSPAARGQGGRHRRCLRAGRQLAAARSAARRGRRPPRGGALHGLIHPARRSISFRGASSPRESEKPSKSPKNHGGVGMDVRVIVRKRPVEDGLMDCITVSAPKLTLLEQKVKVDLTKFMEEHTFTYDDTFGELDDTRELYDRSVQDLVTNVFDGGTSTAFCFGQTASGKTFTLFGAGGGKVMSTSLLEAGAEGEAQKGGVYLLAAYEIYQHVRQLSEQDPEAYFTVALSSKLVHFVFA